MLADKCCWPKKLVNLVEDKQKIHRSDKIDSSSTSVLKYADAVVVCTLRALARWKGKRWHRRMSWGGTMPRSFSTYSSNVDSSSTTFNADPPPSWSHVPYMLLKSPLNFSSRHKTLLGPRSSKNSWEISLSNTNHACKAGSKRDSQPNGRDRSAPWYQMIDECCSANPFDSSSLYSETRLVWFLTLLRDPTVHAMKSQSTDSWQRFPSSSYRHILCIVNLTNFLRSILSSVERDYNGLALTDKCNCTVQYVEN